MPTEYHPSTVKETIEGEPVLLEGEEVVQKFSIGIPPSTFVVVVIATFIPPFVLGILFYLWDSYNRKHGGIWLTNKRVIVFRGKPFSKSRSVTYIPFADIQAAKVDSIGPATPFADMFDKMMGIGDVQIATHSPSTPLVPVQNVKKPKDLIKRVNQASA